MTTRLVWFRVQLAIRALLETRWSSDQWPEAKVLLGRALKLRSALGRAAWWN